jgi:ATP-dependent Clp protease adaptor protein ClpS
MKAAAVAEPVRETRRDSRQQTKHQPRYQVILWNDDDHSYVYVIAMLAKLFGYTVERGYQLACEVDTRGRAVVLTTTLEHAELKRDQIHAFGKDGLLLSCKGSMSATIEPIE